MRFGSSLSSYDEQLGSPLPFAQPPAIKEGVRFLIDALADWVLAGARVGSGGGAIEVTFLGCPCLCPSPRFLRIHWHYSMEEVAIT